MRRFVAISARLAHQRFLKTVMSGRLIQFLNQKENVVGRNKPFDFAQDRLVPAYH